MKQAPLIITPLPAFVDNYVWLLARGTAAAVVDPGDAEPVERALRERGLSLAAILITHHHMDHIGGLAALRRRHDVPVFGPAAEAARIPGLTQAVREGERIRLAALELALEVWEVPGHTAGHIAYVADRAGDGTPLVLCGDTLFSAGCGRLFEGTPEQMHRSLTRLAGLPDDTGVYCTHEYTLANLAFAAAVEPDNAALVAEAARVRELRRTGTPSLPSTIGHERRINPFLRVSDRAVVEAANRHAGRTLEGPEQVFATLRRWKDGFRPPSAT